MKKRIFATLLTLCMVIGLLPTVALAEDDVVAATSGYCGGDTSATSVDYTPSTTSYTVYDNVQWDYDTDTKTLTISGEGAMIDAYSIGGIAYGVGLSTPPWNAYRGEIEHIVIEDGVTYITAFCFAWMDSLTSISFGANVSEFGKMSDSEVGGLFYQDKLETITVNPSNTFIKVGDSGELLSYDGAILYAIPYSLTSYTIPDSVTTISRQACGARTNLTSIDLGSVQVIETYAFLGGGLTSLYVPNTVTSMGAGVFRGQPLETVYFNASSVVVQTFDSLTTLNHLTIGPDVTTINGDTFSKCTGIRTIVIEATNLTAANNVFSATTDCEVIIGENVTNIPSGMFCTSTAFSKVTFEDSDVPLTIGSSAFSGLTDAEFVGDISRVTSLGGSAFYNCDDLSGNLTFDNLTYMGSYALAGTECTSLNINGDDIVIDASSSGYSIERLESVQISANTLLLAWRAFSYNGSLHSVDLSRVVAMETEVTGKVNPYQVAFDAIADNSVIYVGNDTVQTFLSTTYTNVYSRSTTSMAQTNGGSFADGYEFVSGVLAEPTKDGYTFVGWYTDSTFSGDVVTDATVGNTYYAKWKYVDGIEITTEPTDKEYTVFDTFDTAGMVVAVSYNDDSTGDVITDYTVSYENDGTAFAMGDTSVTITATVDDVVYRTTVTVTVAQAAAITFADVPVTQKAANEEAQTVDLGVSMPEDAGTVTYTVSNSGKVSGTSVTDGVLAYTITGGAAAEEVTIPVTVSSTNYENSTVNVVVTLTTLDIQDALTFTSADTMAYDEALDLAVTGGSTNGEVTYTVTNGTGSATITDDVLTATGAGTVTVTATMEGNTDYASVSVNQTITIGKIDQSAITFTNEENSVTVGETLDLVTTAGAEVSGDVTYALAEGDSEYATLDNGVLTGGSAGMVTVTATKAGDADYNDTSTSMTVFVVAADGSVIADPTVEDNGATITYTGGSADTFDITAVDSVTTVEEASLSTVATAAGYTAGDTFHLYALVDESVVDGANFSAPISVTVSCTVESGKTYKVLHLLDGGGTETLDATANTTAGTLTFDVSGLSAFMVVSYVTPSSGGTSTYSSSVASTSNGDVSISSSKSASGTTITVTTDPDSGYEVGDVTVTYSSGKEVSVTDNGDGTYSYLQPGASVTVAATFVATGEEVEDDTLFTDVDDDAYYYDAVLWAVENGITAGYSDGTFAPTNSCTRAQAVTFLWRAAGEPEATIDNPFSDLDETAYYYDAVLWAVENGITAGYDDGTFRPDTTCNRGAIVTFLYRLAGEPDVSGEALSDVADGAYYYDAVLWAVENGITTGYADGTFQPSTTCNRGAIVTFLYRYLA